MNETAPSPKPRKSRRMVVWMVAVPVVILLLAFAGANWKFFHLAYAKHLMRKDDVLSQYEGIQMLLDTQMQTGMTLEEIRGLFHPMEVKHECSYPEYDVYFVMVEDYGLVHNGYCLHFDGEGKLKKVFYRGRQ